MNENKKIAVNSFIIFLRLCLMTFIGIFTSRIVLDKLGASDYGLYNVVCRKGGTRTLKDLTIREILSLVCLPFSPQSHPSRPLDFPATLCYHSQTNNFTITGFHATFLY